VNSVKNNHFHEGQGASRLKLTEDGSCAIQARLEFPPQHIPYFSMHAGKIVFFIFNIFIFAFLPPLCICSPHSIDERKTDGKTLK
jgi:hypothetical protein